MGWGSFVKSAKRSVSKAAKSAASGVQKAGKQAAQNAVNAAAAPVVYTAAVVGKSIGAIAPVLGQATGVIRDNPELAGLAGGLLGIPGLGAAGAMPGDYATAGSAGVAAPEAGPKSWLVLAGLAVAAVVAYLLFKKKASA